MNWTDLAPLLSVAAPTIGKVLGGALPIPFGDQVGSAIGTMLAQALGTPAEPGAVASAIQSAPADVLQKTLAPIEANAAAQWQSLAAMAQATASTMQQELATGQWYQRVWRPAAAFLWMATWPVQLYLIAKNPGQAEQLLGAFASFNVGPAAVCGVYAYGRTQEKIAAVS